MQNDVLYNRIMAEIKKSGGGCGGVMIIYEGEGHPITETWKEITDAYISGKKVLLFNDWEGEEFYSEMIAIRNAKSPNNYFVYFNSGTGMVTYQAASPDSPIAWSD